MKSVESESRRVDFAYLVDWVEGRLSEEEAVAAEQLMAVADETTLADVAWLRMFAEASQKVVLPSPPPGVRDGSINLFETHVRSKRAPDFRKRFYATLTFDSALQRTTAEVRQTDASELGRQLVYAADAADVALDISPHDESRLDLEGQVFPNDEDAGTDSFTVRLLQGETELGATITDDQGEFAFGSVPPGVYEMLLSTEQYDIMVAAPVALEA